MLDPRPPRKGVEDSPGFLFKMTVILKLARLSAREGARSHRPYLHNVQASDELPLHVQLGVRRPVGVRF